LTTEPSASTFPPAFALMFLMSVAEAPALQPAFTSPAPNSTLLSSPPMWPSAPSFFHSWPTFAVSAGLKPSLGLSFMSL
jgi:hypothetical protein